MGLCHVRFTNSIPIELRIQIDFLLDHRSDVHYDDSLAFLSLLGRLFHSLNQGIDTLGKEFTSNRHFWLLEWIFQGTVGIEYVYFSQDIGQVGCSRLGTVRKENMM